MNIFTRTINNIKYAHYRKMREKSLSKAVKHMWGDSNDFKKYAEIYIMYTKKCLETPIK